MATITILKVVPGINNWQVVTYVATNDGATYYKVEGAAFPQGDVQAYAVANADALFSTAQAGGITLSKGRANAATFAYQHWSNRDVFASAQYQYTIGMLGGAATLAAYRTVLVNAYAELAPLSGTQFETEFNNERAAASAGAADITGAPSGFTTIAQCQLFDSTLIRWLTARRLDVLWSMSFYGMHE